MPWSPFPMSTPKWKGRWEVSKSSKFCLCKLQPLGLLTFLKPNSTRDPTNYSLYVMRRGNATWICPSSQMSVTEPQMTLNNPLEAVTNICEPEQWLPNEDSKSLETHSWRCLGQLLALDHTLRTRGCFLERLEVKRQSCAKCMEAELNRGDSCI